LTRRTHGIKVAALEILKRSSAPDSLAAFLCL